MKETFWTYLFIVLGLLTIAIMILIQNLTSTSEENYYTTKEVMEAAMIDSIDYGLYRKTGEIRMIESKFVENFTRRFAESINDSKEYTLDFYEIYENPPKATVVVKTETGSTTITSDSTVNFDIRTVMSGILETKYSQNDSSLVVTLEMEKGSSKAKRKYTNYGGTATFDVIDVPIPYIVDYVKCSDNNEVEVSSKYIKVQNVIRNTSCKAYYKRGNVVKLVVLNSTGSVTGKLEYAVDNNGSAVFTVKAFNNYTLDNPRMYCEKSSTIKSYSNTVTVSDVTSDDTCYIEFQKGGHYLTLNVINGYTDTPTRYVRYGDNATYTITPAEGYTVVAMRKACPDGAVITNNGNNVVISNLNKSQTCTVTLMSKKILGSYYIITSDNIMKHYSSDNELLETKNLNGTFTPDYSGNYTVVLYGGAGGGGGGAYREDGCYIACCVTEYKARYADGGMGGYSASEYANVTLNSTSYNYNVGKGGKGGYRDYQSRYYYDAVGGRGNKGFTTSFSKYSVEGGDGGYGGFAPDYNGSSSNGTVGTSYGNLVTANYYGSRRYRYIGSYTRNNKYDKYGISSYGLPGKGGSPYENGGNGTDGVILLIFNG